MIITVCDVAPLNQFKIYLVPNAVRNFNILSLILGQFEITFWSPNPFFSSLNKIFGALQMYNINHPKSTGHILLSVKESWNSNDFYLTLKDGLLWWW